MDSLTCRSDEIEQDMYSVVSEARITLNSALFGEDIVELSLEIGADLAEAGFIVDAVSKARSIDNCQRDTCTFLVQFELDGDRLDLDLLLLMCQAGLIAVLARENLFAAERVHESCASSP